MAFSGAVDPTSPVRWGPIVPFVAGGARLTYSEAMNLKNHTENKLLKKMKKLNLEGIPQVQRVPIKSLNATKRSVSPFQMHLAKSMINYDKQQVARAQKMQAVRAAQENKVNSVHEESKKAPEATRTVLGEITNNDFSNRSTQLVSQILFDLKHLCEKLNEKVMGIDQIADILCIHEALQDNSELLNDLKIRKDLVKFLAHFNSKVDLSAFFQQPLWSDGTKKEQEEIEQCVEAQEVIMHWQETSKPWS